MLAVIGGVYRENCLDPAFYELLGSGGRAALALSGVLGPSVDIHLYSALTPREVQRFDPVLRAVRVNPHWVPREQQIEFQYNHSADKAVLYPDFRDLQQIADLEVPPRLDNALLFSLIEAASLPTFSANRVVYDPQAGTHAVPFRTSRSQAKSLAIVCNLTEASVLSRVLHPSRRSRSPYDHARVILQEEGAEVVVIKNGPFGALVVTENERQNVPSYKVPSVFGIGTGDIFSAVFAAMWAQLRRDPFSAAEDASLATAYACSRRRELLRVPVIPKQFRAEAAGFAPANLKNLRRDGSLGGRGKRHVYLAAPFFSLSQLWLVNELARALMDMHLQVWSPMAEAGVLPPDAALPDVREIVKKDLSAIDESGMIFAVLDGLDPGTLFEVGYAAARGVPIIALSQQPAPGDLTMLRGTSACHMFTDIATALYFAAWIGHGL